MPAEMEAGSIMKYVLHALCVHLSGCFYLPPDITSGAYFNRGVLFAMKYFSKDMYINC